LCRSANLNDILRFCLSEQASLSFDGFKGQCADPMLSSATKSTSEISNKRAANAELLVHNPESRFGLQMNCLQTRCRLSGNLRDPFLFCITLCEEKDFNPLLHYFFSSSNGSTFSKYQQDDCIGSISIELGHIRFGE
jgi:hypothetical protein